MKLAEKSAERPLTVNIAVWIFAFNALLMIVWWVFLPNQVVSNGSQVFFVTLWLMIAGLFYVGAGWVRYAAILLWVLFILAWYNTMGLNTDNPATLIAKVFSLIAIVLAFLPSSHKWFRWIYLTEIEEEHQEKARRKAQAG